MGLFSSPDRPPHGLSEEELALWTGFRVSHQPPNGGGWIPVEEFDKLEEPIAKDEFLYNTGELEPGKYRIYAIRKGMNKKPSDHPLYEAEGWTHEVEAPNEEADAEIRRLERKLDMLMDAQSGPSAEEEMLMSDPDTLDKQLAVRMKMAALNSEEFMRRHGEQVMLSMFATGATAPKRDSPGYQDYQESPIGAAMYETFSAAMNEPEKLERVGQAIGGGLGRFMAGASTGIADSPAASPAQPAPPADPTEDPEFTPREVDSGRSEFGPVIEDDEAESLEAEAEAIAAVQARAERLTTATRSGFDPEPASAATATESEPFEPAPADDFEVVDRKGGGLSAGPTQAGANGDGPAHEMDDGYPDDDAPEDAYEGERDDDTEVPVEVEEPRCVAFTSAGKRCKNEPEEGSEYCHVSTHHAPGEAPDTEAAEADDDGYDPIEVEADPDAEPTPDELADML